MSTRSSPSSHIESFSTPEQSPNLFCNEKIESPEVIRNSAVRVKRKRTLCGWQNSPSPQISSYETRRLKRLKKDAWAYNHIYRKLMSLKVQTKDGYAHYEMDKYMELWIKAHKYWRNVYLRLNQDYNWTLEFMRMWYEMRQDPLDEIFHRKETENMMRMDLEDPNFTL